MANEASLETNVRYRVKISAAEFADALTSSGVKPTKSKKSARLSFLADKASMEISLSVGARKSVFVAAHGMNGWELVTDGAKLIRLLSTFSGDVEVELQPKLSELLIVSGRGSYAIPASDLSVVSVGSKFKEIKAEPVEDYVRDRPLRPSVEQMNTWGFTLQIPWPRT